MFDLVFNSQDIYIGEVKNPLASPGSWNMGLASPKKVSMCQFLGTNKLI